MIVILSDTHEQFEAVDCVLGSIGQLQPELIIHCGDFTSPEMFQRFVGLPFVSVFGNCDSRHESYTELAAKLGMQAPQHSLELEKHGKRIFVSHGDRPFSLLQAVASDAFDYVFHGHTHVLSDEWQGKSGRTRVINPGAFTRVASKSFAKVWLEDGRCEFEYL